MMNNKQIGTDFENAMVDLLAKQGYWVHFISPDKRGAQPFDIIAVKHGYAVAIDCKTCKDHIFRLGRLEENQILAFEKWIACGNEAAYLAVEHGDKIYMIQYQQLREEGSIDLDKM